jgi:hypothetical protein
MECNTHSRKIKKADVAQTLLFQSSPSLKEYTNARRLEKRLVHERKILVDGIEGNLHKQLAAKKHQRAVF